MEPEKRKQIEDEIVKTMIQALESKSITDEQMSVIAAFVLDNLENVADEASLELFLSDLSSRWLIFKPISILRLRDLQERIEDEVAEGVLLLAKHGKIENAIQLAKSGTKKQV